MECEFYGYDDDEETLTQYEERPLTEEDVIEIVLVVILNLGALLVASWFVVFAMLYVWLKVF